MKTSAFKIVIVLAWLLLSDAPKQEDGSVAEPAE